MDIFISWSGERARKAARMLREWLRYVMQGSSPWMSDEDLDPGTRWGMELARKLETCNVGIICMTRESLRSPWVLFEAGALAKALSGSFVCPYLLDIRPEELPAPLAQFNAVEATAKGTQALLHTINRAMATLGDKSRALDEDLLQRTFEKWWPVLDKNLSTIPHVSATEASLPVNNAMGLECVYECRSPALDQFASYLDDEIAHRNPDTSSGIWIVGTSMRCFLVPSGSRFDGPGILKKAIAARTHLHILLSRPDFADMRGPGEGRPQNAIAGEVRQSIQQLKEIGVPRDSIRYYPGSPTVFGVATDDKMLLNPYPLEKESHRCFTLVVRRTAYDHDIYHQYRDSHFAGPWEHSKRLRGTDWELPARELHRKTEPKMIASSRPRKGYKRTTLRMGRAAADHRVVSSRGRKTGHPDTVRHSS